MNWLELTRPLRICCALRLDTTVTSQPCFCNPSANCRPDCPAPTIAILLMACSSFSSAHRPPAAKHADSNDRRRTYFPTGPYDSICCEKYKFPVCPPIREGGNHGGPERKGGHCHRRRNDDRRARGPRLSQGGDGSCRRRHRCARRASGRG